MSIEILYVNWWVHKGFTGTVYKDPKEKGYEWINKEVTRARIGTVFEMEVFSNK